MIRLALLDMYDGYKNVGLSSIRRILEQFQELEIKVFDVRSKCEIPGIDFDIYLASGGPGSPLAGDGVWDRAFFFLIDRIWKHNQQSDEKKYVFFICHSFQMMCRHLSLASVVRRKSESLGVYPVHKTIDAQNDDLFKYLPDPFYVADSREWQVIQADKERMKYLNCEILALEKERPHVALEQAIMSIRFSDEMIGTQFHPEADTIGMRERFSDENTVNRIINDHGSERMDKILANLDTFGKDLDDTNRYLLPAFLRSSIGAIEKYKAQFV